MRFVSKSDLNFDLKNYFFFLEISTYIKRTG